jgi:hypothetical protein
MESSRFFEDFHFKAMKQEIDQTPTKTDPISNKEDVQNNEPFNLTPMGARALDLLLNSPGGNSEELQKSIQKLTPFPGDKNELNYSSNRKTNEI